MYIQLNLHLLYRKGAHHRRKSRHIGGAATFSAFLVHKSRIKGRVYEADLSNVSGGLGMGHEEVIKDGSLMAHLRFWKKCFVLEKNFLWKICVLKCWKISCF